ncbi:DUF6463 family protein [Rugamonas sp. CCM 8940]|uniref:DUF6463 family protein n=1 Tax=Rugamonas sp. CCM 8940 TaxID=2765359 RepID=UPI0018F66456|nr:DUF6463 family protein [Rugamonas sp. CCM 8940]MBJ7311450.1 hypothetical protein [Rugamonas sp. CCM 8940]
MQINWMATSAWAVLALGVGHILMGLLRFRQAFLETLRDGLVGQFHHNDTRRVGFWFTIFGPLLMLVGHLAVNAARAGDLHLFSIIGGYLIPIALLGVIAWPRSPFWAALIVGGVLLAVGQGWLA